MQTMETKKTSNRNVPAVAKFAAAAVSALLVAGLTGCGLGSGSSDVQKVAPSGSLTISGSVYGGQSPIGGANVYMYAASQTGYGTASTLVTQTTTSSTLGATYGTFSLVGSASLCSPSTALIYIVAVGGSAGSGTNANSTLMAAVGPCNNFAASYPHFIINEASTVAGVWALAPFMSDYQHVATSSTNVTGLTEAFANATQLSNIVTGSAPGTLPTSATAPQTTIYTLADILAACVNTNGTGGSSSNCSTLFTNANMGTTPTDTIKAALIMAQNPALTSTKLTNLYGLVSASSPFQPALSAAPADLTLSITYAPSTLNAPSAIAIDASGQAWMTNSGNSTLTVLSNAGVVNSAITGSSSSLSGPSAIAIDASGNAWIANKTNSTVSEVTSSGGNGANSPSTGGGMSSPVGVAIDNAGTIWVANSGNTTVTSISSSGSTATGYTGADPYGAVGIAINPH